MSRIIALCKRFRHEILYLFFGGCTTLVNVAAYALCTRALSMTTLWATALSWLLAVLFAYATNRRWVFESHASGAREVGAEIARFFAGRAATGLMDMAIMYASVDVLGANDMIMKLASNVLVIILNYVISRLIVFRSR